MKIILAIILSSFIFYNFASAEECTPTPKYYCSEKGVLTICPVGFYCPGEKTEKIACPPGTYSSGIGAAACTKCFSAMPANAVEISWTGTSQTSKANACTFASMKCSEGFHYHPMANRCDVDCVASAGFHCANKNADPVRCPASMKCPGGPK
jgi:hypothetical protein